MKIEELRLSLEAALEDLDRSRVRAVCQQLVELAEVGGEPVSVRTARAVLSALRRRRYFPELCQVGAAFSMAGIRDARVRRLYAQGLIEERQYAQALEFLRGIIDDTAAPPKEVAEAHGLVGRLYKQRYVDAGADSARRGEFLSLALRHYLAVFERDREQLWHGVNVVALLARAERDGLEVDTDRDYRETARNIAEMVEDRVEEGGHSLWDIASALEAEIALGREERAVSFAEQYVRRATSDGADQFEYGSTLRQLREVWGATPADFVGRRIVPLLEAVMVDVAVRATPGGGASLQRETLRLLGTDEGVARLEKVFDKADRYLRLEWFALMRERSPLIGKVIRPDGGGVGTGFLVRGKALCDALEDDWYFLTNSHVISDDDAVRMAAPAAERPLRASEATIRFEVLFRRDKPKIRLGKVVWSSPPDELDATLVELGEPFYEDELQPFPLGDELPDPASRPRMYIMGHPNGRELSVSVHDNHLIEFDEVLLRYRTPTNPGSSGSPVFDDQWRLVGLHHAGSKAMTGLKDAAKMVEANEGIRMSAIIGAVRRYFTDLTGSSDGLQGGD